MRLIFRRYLELGSIRDLAEDLDRNGIRTPRQVLANGQTRGGIRFGVGPLAHLLRNRFYIGEVAYHGAIHPGEQQSIIDRSLFEAVQAKLGASANTRALKLKSSPSILTGHIFDDRGNRMTPSHRNKQGARYRYYVSHALLQKRNEAAGGLKRVAAPDIEFAVTRTVRDHFNESAEEKRSHLSDRELIQRYVDRITVKPQDVEIRFLRQSEGDCGSLDKQNLATTGATSASVITLPWTIRASTKIKGVLHAPSPSSAMSAEKQELLLTAIAKARAWIEDLANGRVFSFAEIAKREGKVERHIRLLAPLAFISPKLISDISEGTLPAIGVTELAKRAAFSWSKQPAAARE